MGKLQIAKVCKKVKQLILKKALMLSSRSQVKMLTIKMAAKPTAAQLPAEAVRKTINFIKVFDALEPD